VVTDSIPDKVEEPEYFHFILKYMGDIKGGLPKGLCLKLGADKKTFIRSTCDITDESQWFVGHGSKKLIENSAMGTFFDKVYTLNRTAPAVGTTDAELTALGLNGNGNEASAIGFDAMRESYTNIELVHTRGACYKLRWPENKDRSDCPHPRDQLKCDGPGVEKGPYAVDEKCLVPKTTDSEELFAEPCNVDAGGVRCAPSEADCKPRTDMEFVLKAEDVEVQECESPEDVAAREAATAVHGMFS